MSDPQTNIEIGRKIFSLRDAVNDKLYNALVDACQIENIQISPEEGKKVVAYCQAEITKLFNNAVDQFVKH
tara:strand:+ start:570 stop:782 length:213 start_codon:yes stop_codon:yes gene_type:complete